MIIDKKLTQYMPQIKQVMQGVCDWHNIRYAKDWQDKNECTDVVANLGKLAVRIRDASCTTKRDLTIRNRLYLVESEIDKILKSPVTHYFLAYLKNNKLVLIYIIDVLLMRKRNIFKKMMLNYMSNNNDSTGFYYYPLSEMKECILWQY